MDIKDEFKEIDIKNRTCYHFANIMRIIIIDFNNILLDEKLYKNLLIYNISYENLWLKNHCVFDLIK